MAGADADHSATDLGIVVALQTLPVLLLGPYGGVIADRVDKRRLMIVLQTLMGIQALVLGVLTLTHHVTYFDVCMLAVVLGLNNCFENPSRQSFVLEMVGPDDLRNAVSLNSTWSTRPAPSARGRRDSDRHGGRRLVLHAQCGEFRRRRDVVADHGPHPALAESTDESGPGAVARGVPLRGAHAATRRAPPDDGPGRHARL